MPPRNLWGGLNSLRRHVVSPSEDERDRKTDQQKHDHKAQRPIRQFPCRKNRRTNLNDECRSDDIRSRDAIDFPPLQLREEAGHKHTETSAPYSRAAVSTGKCGGTAWKPFCRNPLERHRNLSRGTR